MKITKKKLDDIKRCYVTSSISYDNKQHFIFSSEDPNVGCKSFSGDDFQIKEEIWKEPGGCMSIIPIPGKEKEILAIQEFYLKVSPSLSKLVWGKKIEDKWEFQDVLDLPYLHRFDLYKVDNKVYFIGATIATSKEHKEDWTVPGRIYVGEIPDNLEEGIKVEIIKDGLYRNHGYCGDVNEKGIPCGYFGSDEGIYKVEPPTNGETKWKIDKILNGTIGEIAIIDIDGDNEKEIMTIEPFHGNEIHIYKSIKDKWERVYTYENEIEFAHSLTSGTLRGVPSFIAGVRRKDAELFCVQYNNGKFITNVIDKGVGPANLFLVNQKHRDLILSANHTANEAAIYVITD